jgi:hypothetical protein
MRRVTHTDQVLQRELVTATVVVLLDHGDGLAGNRSVRLAWIRLDNFGTFLITVGGLVRFARQSASEGRRSSAVGRRSRMRIALVGESTAKRGRTGGRTGVLAI